MRYEKAFTKYRGDDMLRGLTLIGNYDAYW